ncbi:MAG: hypothetical protein ACRC57_03520 [Sarcina sp.]
MKREDLIEKFLNEERIYIRSKEEVRDNFKLENCFLAMIAFHKAVARKNNYNLGIISEAGKLYQDQKISYKRAKLLVEELSLNNLDIINVATKCINLVNEKDVIFLIKKSYDTSQITLGRIYQNVCLNNEEILVYDVSKIRFGLIEDDFIRFIRKNKNKKIDYIQMINDFCEKENLNDISKNYIKSLLLYPKEIIDYLANCYVKSFTDIDEILSNIENMKNKFYQRTIII